MSGNESGVKTEKRVNTGRIKRGIQESKRKRSHGGGKWFEKSKE